MDIEGKYEEGKDEGLTWKRVDSESTSDMPFGLDGIMGMDPAANWLFGPAAKRFFPEKADGDTRIPFLMSLVSLSRDLKDPEARSKQLRHYGKIFGDDLAATFEKLDPDAVASIGLKKKDIDRLFESTEIQKALAALKLEIAAAITSPHSSDGVPEIVKHEVPCTAPDVPGGQWPCGKRQTVVMGVIDDAICYAHEAFRDKQGGTRVHAFWQQDGTLVSPTVPFGREIFKAGASGIDAMLSDAALSANNVDEDALYQSAGFIDFSAGSRQLAALRFTHGTHVLDIAAGHHPSENKVNRPIVAVQLPSEVVEQSSGTELDYYAISAVDYILTRAKWLANGGDPLPVVITMSYGFIAGPHDGSTRIERAIDKLLEDYRKECCVPAELVLSAGNSHLSRCHADFTFEDFAPPPVPGASKRVTLDWRILPDDKTDSFVEIWLPFDKSVSYDPNLPRFLQTDRRVRVRLTAPNGKRSNWVTGVNGHTERLLPASGAPTASDAIAELKYLFVGGDTKRGMFRLTIAPTAEIDLTPGAFTAPAGIWKIEIQQGDLSDDAQIDCWVQRDDTIYGYPQRGRQSFFENGGYRVTNENGLPIVEDDAAAPGALVRRRALVSAIATGKEPVVVGAYEAKTDRPSDYCSGGPVTAPLGKPPQFSNGPRPDLLGLADWSRATGGILAAGARSGSVVASDGTSAAAPFVARLMADWITDGGPVGRVRARAEATDNETSLPASAPVLSDDRSGWGRSPKDTVERRILTERLRGLDQP